MGMPSSIRAKVFEYLWNEADSMNWNALTISEKTLQYKNWAQSDDVGGVLSKYMSIERVHPYIKDSIMKSYTKNKKKPISEIIKIAGFKKESQVIKEFVKPFGIIIESGEVIVWGRAVDWKIILLALYERTYNNELLPSCVILDSTSGRFSTADFRNLVMSSAMKLGINKVIFE